MKNIELTGKYGKNKYALVDDEDFEKINQYLWHLSGKYAVKSYGVRPNRTKISMHRFIMNAEKGVMIDHINGNELDNRKCNLRLCTNSQNQMNAKKQSNSSSEYKGVTKNKPWRASIGSKTIGHFNTEIEAAEAYDSKAKELYGEFANINFPIM